MACVLMEIPLSIATADELEKHLVELINAERGAEGLPDLKIEAHLNAAAQSHADWMAETGTFSHEGENGSSAADRIEDAGYPLSASGRAAENLAYVSIDGPLDAGEAQTMHDGLMDSPSHRAAIMDPDLAHVGIGLSVGTIDVGGGEREVVFLTQNFGNTDGEVLVQEEVDGETVLQPYQDGEPVGEPADVETPATGDPDQDDEPEDESDSGGGCFVATAAYGDRDHPDVAALRRFRDEVLAAHAAGRAFIRAYRIAGPKLARIVSPDRASGRAARALIAPLARLARASTRTPR